MYWGWLYATRVKLYNPLFRNVARIFLYIFLHVPTYLGKGGSPTFSDLDVFADQTVLYKFEMRICIKQWEDPFCIAKYFIWSLSFLVRHFHIVTVILWQFGTSCNFMRSCQWCQLPEVRHSCCLLFYTVCFVIIHIAYHFHHYHRPWKTHIYDEISSW